MANCTYNGQDYSQGAVTCQNGNEFICDNGTWSRTGAQCSEEVKTFTSFRSVGSTELQDLSILAPGCVNFVDGTYPGTTVPLYNKCDQAKMTRIFWFDGSAPSDFCVRPHSTLWINTGGKSGRIIDEFPC